MKNRKEILQTLYTPEWEDARLVRDRQGEAEFITTMHYIHKEIKAGARIAEIGAATGRYSVTLAKEGYDVTAVEFLDDNVEVLKKNCEGIQNIRAFQGDAVNLSMLKDNEFDATLLFGPMYHLYTEQEQRAALNEARRITKKGGIIMIAFLSIYAIMHDDYLQDNFIEGFEENYTEDFKVKHFKEQIFTGFDIAEFEEFVESTGLKRQKTVATDGVLELAKDRTDFGFSDENFAKFMEYHLRFCEKRELLGCSSHLLLVCTNEKEEQEDMQLVRVQDSDYKKTYDLYMTFPEDENGFVNTVYGYDYEEFLNWIEKKKDWSQGKNLPENFVADTTYVIEVDGKYVGAVNLRHYLNDFLREGPGHIGYGVSKVYRGKGYATEALKLALVKAKEKGIDEAYLSVNKDNTASLKVQQKNGAIIHHEDDLKYYTRIAI